jgi:hypothetical protein
MQCNRLKRREFITLLGGSAATWPLAAHAQQGERLWRVSVLMPFYENDPEGRTFVSAFTQALAGLGWTDGRNVRMDAKIEENLLHRTAGPYIGVIHAGPTCRMALQHVRCALDSHRTCALR